MADFGGTEDKVNDDEDELVAKAEKEKTELVISKPLMQEEDRNTGQIQWKVYNVYMSAAGGLFLALFIIFTLLAEQAAQSTYLAN